jgi:quercetin dioxygenase-like cupin family protein
MDYIIGMKMNILGLPTTVKVAGRESGDRFLVFEHEVGPGLGVPPHVHTREDEVLTVLEGTAACVYDGRPITLEAGDARFLPAEIPHGFHNPTDRLLRVQFTVSPADSFERFLKELGDFPEVTPESPPDLGKVAALLEAYGMRFVDV